MTEQLRLREADGQLPSIDQVFTFVILIASRIAYGDDNHLKVKRAYFDFGITQTAFMINAAKSKVSGAVGYW
jgi:hypothetical protein